MSGRPHHSHSESAMLVKTKSPRAEKSTPLQRNCIAIRVAFCFSFSLFFLFFVLFKRVQREEGVRGNSGNTRREQK